MIDTRRGSEFLDYREKTAHHRYNDVRNRAYRDRDRGIEERLW